MCECPKQKQYQKLRQGSAKQVSPTDNLSETSWAKPPYSISEYGHNTEKYITPAQQNIDKKS